MLGGYAKWSSLERTKGARDLQAAYPVIDVPGHRAKPRTGGRSLAAVCARLEELLPTGVNADGVSYPRRVDSASAARVATQALEVGQDDTSGIGDTWCRFKGCILHRFAHAVMVEQ